MHRDRAVSCLKVKLSHQHPIPKGLNNPDSIINRGVGDRGEGGITTVIDAEAMRGREIDYQLLLPLFVITQMGSGARTLTKKKSGGNEAVSHASTPQEYTCYYVLSFSITITI